MDQIPAVDKIYLDAAEGWLGLGNSDEANKELERIRPQSRRHPDVLAVRVIIYERAGQWEYAAEVARAMTGIVPQESFGWIRCAFALHELKRTREALKVLLPVADKFPEKWVIPYNLACYSCQLGDLRGAMKWLTKAIDLAGKKEVRRMALEDPDLEALWAHIEEI